jgi:hypothetical protein
MRKMELAPSKARAACPARRDVGPPSERCVMLPSLTA